MILVITNFEKDDMGKKREFVSHGINLESDRVVVLPQVSPEEIAVFDLDIGEWILK